jgi:hypothetical protein
MRVMNFFCTMFEGRIWMNSAQTKTRADVSPRLIFVSCLRRQATICAACIRVANPNGANRMKATVNETIFMPATYAWIFVMASSRQEFGPFAEEMQ